MMKRSVKICAGDKPLRSNIFVNTKVLPHTAKVTKARKCARYLLSINHNLELSSSSALISLNHDLTTVDDDKSFVTGINLLPRQIVVRA